MPMNSGFTIDDLPAKSVIVFQHTHEDGGKRYTYAAINSANGWHLTSRPGAMSTAELLAFIGQESIQLMNLGGVIRTDNAEPERGSMEWHRARGHLVGEEVPGER